MLTPYLENLIQKGKARFRTFVVGQSGSNLLPVEDNNWIIITGFTYCNFSDPETPITGSQYNEYIARSVHQIRFRSSKSNNHYIVKDDIRRDVGAAGMDINQIINGDFATGDNWTLGAGWLIGAGEAQHTGLGGAGDITNISFTNIPLRRYRLTYNVTTVVGAGTVQPFLGGIAGFVRSTVGLFSEEIVGGVTAPNQLLFRAPAGLGNDINIDNVELILLPEPDVVSINGHYKFDCYLPHQNEVTVELVTFSPTGIITQISAAAPASFPLAAPPAGYGNAGFGGIAQVTEFRNDIGGFEDIDLPLTRIHTNPAVVAGDIIQNGMEIGVSILTAINQPTFDADFGPRNFPIIDIQYVEIQSNMPAWIQASN